MNSNLVVVKRNYQKSKMFGIRLEERLNFDFYVNLLVKKASKKYHALSREFNYMVLYKRRSKIKVFRNIQIYI